MSNLPIDARAILEYLNELGYRNISAEQLKEFMKDLRKLIKYEERFGINTLKPDYFDLLHRHVTASFRAKVKDKENASNLLPILNSSVTTTRTLSEEMGKKKGGADAAPAAPAVETRCLPLSQQPPSPDFTKGNDPKRLPRSVPLMTISSQNEITGPLLYLPSDCSINIPDTSINELRNRFEETMKFPFAQCERTRFQRNSWMLRKGDCGAQVHKRCDECELPPNIGSGYMRCLAQCSPGAGGGKKKGKKKKKQSDDMRRSPVPVREEGGYSPDEENANMENDNADASVQSNSITKSKSSYKNKEIDILEKQKIEILSKFNSRELLETLEHVVLRKAELELKEQQMQLNKQSWVSKPQIKHRETPYIDLDGVSSSEAFNKVQQLIKENESSGNPNRKTTNNVNSTMQPKERVRSPAAEKTQTDMSHRARQSAITTCATKINDKSNRIVMATSVQLVNPFDMAAQRKKRELEKSSEKLATKPKNTGCIKKTQGSVTKSRDMLEATTKDNLSHTGAILSQRSSQHKIRKSKSQDPVALYHYYRRQWQQFRKQIPGEDSRQNFRRPVHAKSKDDEK